MKLKYIILSFLFIAVMLHCGHGADFKNVGHSGANFLQIPVDPVGAGMGNSFVAMAGGVDGLYWNPAAISLTRGTEMAFNTVDWVIDTRISHFGLTHNFEKLGTIGFQITAFTMDEMEITNELNPNGTGEFFDAGDYAFGLTYARAVTDRFSFGVTAKYVYEYIWEANTGVLAFDFGSLYRTDFYGLRIGMNIANFGGNLKMSGDPLDDKLRAEAALNEQNNPRSERLSESYSLPQLFNVGVAFEPYHGEMQQLTLSATANDPNDNNTRVSYGAQYAFRNMFFLRTGLKTGYEEQLFSAGVGFKISLGQIQSQLDYGYSDFGVLGEIHYMGIKFNF